tara:strand:+ start:176 stop:409 length:234 start_codon:yes stop_codon:yes gene_type:complete
MKGGGLKNSKQTRKRSPSNLGRAQVLKTGKIVQVVVSMPGSKAGIAQAKKLKDAMNEQLAAHKKNTRRRSPSRKSRK